MTTLWIWTLIFVCMIMHDILYVCGRWFVKSPINLCCWLWSFLLKIFLPISGVKVIVSGLENIPSKGPYIIASNHQSIADIPILNAVVPPGFAFYAKKELMYVPIIGWNLKMMGCFLIDRKNPREALKDLDDSRKKVALGRALLIFPEGTRSVDGNLSPFKRGGFSVAVQTGVPVIPCVIDGSYKIINKKNFWALPGKVSVTFGAPISVTKVDKDAEKKASTVLMHKTYHIIRSIMELNK